MDENKMIAGDPSGEVPAKRDIAVITKEIKDIQRQAKAMALTYAVEIGRRLCEAKSLLPYGSWGEWLRNEVEFSQSSANNFMRLFDEYGSAQISIFGASVDSQTFANLPYSKALQLLAIPSEEREAFAEEVGAEDLSTRELAAAIKEKEDAKREAEELREKLRALEEAEADLRQKADDYDEMEKDLKFAEEEREKAIKEAKTLGEKLNQAKSDPKISKATIDKMKAEAEAAAKKAADEAAAKKLAELENRLRDAEAAKIRAELLAKTAQDDAERAQREAKTSSPDVAEFKTLFDELQALAVKCLAAIRKIKGRDPKVGEGCEKALRAFGEKL